jgi:hypothetical protein
MVQAVRSLVSFHMTSFRLFNLSNASSRTNALAVYLAPDRDDHEKTILGSKARPARKAENLAAKCEAVIWTMWENQRITTLQVSTACYGDSFFMSYYFLNQ